MDTNTVILAIAAAAGLYMAWNIGANDVANAMGTSVGSGALTIKRAIIVAAIFEFGGAMLVGGTVTTTIRKGIVDVGAFEGDPLAIAIGMTCCLLAAAIWLNIATYAGWPVSTTHSIVGAVVGFAIVAGGADAVDWAVMAKIVASWIVSPLCGGILGFLGFVFIKRRILNADRPLLALRGWGPIMVFPIFAILALSVIFKGLKPLKLDLPLGPSLGIAVLVGIFASTLSVPLLRRVTAAASKDRGDHVHRAERVFLVLQVLTACFVAFAHGSNDVANAVGPMAAVFGTLKGGVTAKVAVPHRVLLIGAIGIVIGLATYGYKIMATVGKKITELTPSRGFAAEFGAATTIVVASKLGLPVSTTHTLVGAVIGVGFARGIAAINMSIVRQIIASWVITVPFAAVLAGVLYALARLFV